MKPKKQTLRPSNHIAVETNSSEIPLSAFLSLFEQDRFERGTIAAEEARGITVMVTKDKTGKVS